MKRPLFLALTVITALVAAVLPIAISMRMAEDEVTRREQERLEWYTNAAVARMEMVMAEVTEALREMEGLPDAPCSDGNLASMRRVAFTYSHLSDAGCCAGTCRLCSALFGDVFRRHMTAPSPGNALADTTLQTIRHLGQPGLPGAVLRQVPHAGACARGDRQENLARADLELPRRASTLRFVRRALPALIKFNR